jgi:N-acetylneuraminate synthase/N,N'-diacetyllegionaminate synthase
VERHTTEPQKSTEAQSVNIARTTFQKLQIENRGIGEGQPCFIIAEAGVNHGGDLALAHRLVDAAATAGVDAVKFQTFTAERLAIQAAPKAAYQLHTTDAGESQLDMLRQLELGREAHGELMAHCRRRGVLFMSSPFDEDSADFLDALGVIVFKVPSGELTNLSLLAHMARKGKPLIVSTGMSRLDEVERAVQAIRGVGNRQLVLLHCVSNYPAEPADVNLRAMQTMRASFGVPIGYSDHTNGTEVALAAVALGACVLEKHFTLDRDLPGPDQRASLEPEELAALVRGVRLVESALGHGRKEPAPSEAQTAAAVRKSVVAARDIPGGSLLTEDCLTVKRPGTGLAPQTRSQLIGRVAKQNIPAGSLMSWDLVS